jgi:hypothetical protein
VVKLPCAELGYKRSIIMWIEGQGKLQEEGD